MFSKVADILFPQYDMNFKMSLQLSIFYPRGNVKKFEMTVHSFPALKRVKFSYLFGLPDKTVDNHSLFFQSIYQVLTIFKAILLFLINMKPYSDLVLGGIVMSS